MKLLVKSVLAAVVFSSLSVSAFASSVVDGKCTSVASSNGCLFSGNINGNSKAGNASSYLNAQNAYNLYNDTHPSANPDITLKFLGDTVDGFPGTFTGGSGIFGTWTLNSGFLANFVAIKSSNAFILYQINPANSGTWSSAGLMNNNDGIHELSHLVFFGTQGAVPEPATWMMMLIGFGLIGSVMRNRKTVPSFA